MGLQKHIDSSDLSRDYVVSYQKTNCIKKASEKNDHKCNRPDHPRHSSAEFKYEVLRRCFELGEDVEYVSREIGYSRMSIYTWRRKYLKYGMVGLMAKRKSIPRKPLPADDPKPQSEEMQALQEQVRYLQFEVDVLKETLAVLKKDPGTNLTVLKNREKVVIIGALSEKYELPMLLTCHHCGVFKQVCPLGKRQVCGHNGAALLTSV